MAAADARTLSAQTTPRSPSNAHGRLNARTDGHFVATYHYIRERNTDGVTGITPVEFAQQVRAIAAAFHVVTVAEFAAQHRRTTGLALITFDDALRDQWRAAEILDSLRLPGVFFAPMRPYSQEADRWCPQHLLHALAEHLGWAKLERSLAPYLAEVTIDTAEADRLYHYEVPHKRALKYALAFALPAERTAQILREVNADVGLLASEWYLRADQLVKLEDAGHALGGHGFDHVPYSRLTPQAQAADMHRALRTMQAVCGARPRPIAYPFGGCDEATESIAAACGHTIGFTTANRIDAKFVLEELARPASRQGDRALTIRAERGRRVAHAVELEEPR
ncbi:MAG: polysaccharide deacetylase family protein [Planctomycetota bacterium]